VDTRTHGHTRGRVVDGAKTIRRHPSHAVVAP
jgi:hypothetical protein